MYLSATDTETVLSRNADMLTEEAFRQIYDSCFDELCRFLSFYSQDSAVIEDIVQDIFVNLWNERGRINISYVKAYLMQSAKNRMLNHLRNICSRKEKLSLWAINEMNHANARDSVDMEEFFALSKAAVEQLPAKCRRIFIMSRDEKLSYKEIALRLDISVKTVETQMGIALKRVREYVRTHVDDPAYM